LGGLTIRIDTDTNTQEVRIIADALFLHEMSCDLAPILEIVEWVGNIDIFIDS
jgi:hypothetical protein